MQLYKSREKDNSDDGKTRFIRNFQAFNNPQVTMVIKAKTMGF